MAIPDHAAWSSPEGSDRNENSEPSGPLAPHQDHKVLGSFKMIFGAYVLHPERMRAAGRNRPYVLAFAAFVLGGGVDVMALLHRLPFV